MSLFVERKKDLVDEMKEIIEKVLSKDKDSTLDIMEPRIVDLSDLFNEALFALWKELMTIEMRLFEQCEVRHLDNHFPIAELLIDII